MRHIARFLHNLDDVQVVHRMTACSLSVIIACRPKSLLPVYTSVVSDFLCTYDLRSVDESKTILHRLYAVVGDYINAFVE